MHYLHNDHEDVKISTKSQTGFYIFVRFNTFLTFLFVVSKIQNEGSSKDALGEEKT